jgi:hypothetical protein
MNAATEAVAGVGGAMLFALALVACWNLFRSLV